MRELHEGYRKVMLMMIAGDVELLGVVVKKIDVDVDEVVFSACWALIQFKPHS